MEQVANGGDGDLFRSALLDTIDAITMASYGVARKEKTMMAFQEMEIIIESMDFHAKFEPKTDFEYSYNYEGLCNLLGELSINPKDVKITIDAEEKTFQAGRNYNFGRLKQGNSESSIQIRLSDLLSGFIGRMLYALKHDESAIERELVDIEKIDLVDWAQKRLLSPNWFEIKEPCFEFYKLLYRTLIVQHKHYWTALTTIYSDDTICLFSLLRYFASYKTYKDFSSISAQMHTEYYNSCAVEALADYYQRM